MPQQNHNDPISDRLYWIGIAERLASPVLTNLANRRLRAAMPVQIKQGHADLADRANCAHLEAFGRLLMGIAPWLELGGDDADEGWLRQRYADLAREGLDAATDPGSPDRMNFGSPAPGLADHARNQALVDTAFLAQALVRAPVELWSKLDERVRGNVVAALVESRVVNPGPNNWLLFSAMVEAALAKAGFDYDPMRVSYAVRQHDAWYKGDGIYGDGREFHWDYYNSFVIQPMLLDILATVDPSGTGKFGMTYETALARAKRTAVVYERLISPEGTIPPIGRSLAYRMGALQILGHVALLGQLPCELTPAQVRGAMTAVMKRLMDAPGTFDADGWLRIGFCGDQPGLGEPYICTGSLYLCSAGLLPLGLSKTDPFWSAAAAPWTSIRVYGGEDTPADHAI